MNSSRPEAERPLHRVRSAVARSAIAIVAILPAASPAHAQQNHAAAMYERASLSRAKGKDAAPLFVYEFADFQCPHCARFALDVFPRIDSAYVKTGKVHWVFVNLPLPTHRNAWLAHEAAVCGGAVADRFWAMHDRVFATQDEWGEIDDPSTILKRLGKEAGVPAEPLAACMAGDRVSQILLQDVIFAASARVNGTPAFIVNNEQSVVGLKSFEEWQELLDKMIKTKTGKDEG
jgi:protein-disulfide isomerase